MSKTVMKGLAVWVLLLSMMAAPVWSRSDFLEKMSKSNAANGYAFRPNGLQSVADDDSQSRAEIARSATKAPRSLGTRQRVYDIAGPGITVEKTWEDWQYTVGNHRVDWKTVPDINFVYSDKPTSGQNDRYGYNIYSPTGGGGWPQGLEVGCEVQTTDLVGRWPNMDLNGNGHIVLTGADDAGGVQENHTFYQTSTFGCFWGGGTVINQSQYTPGFLDPVSSELINPAVEYQEWAGDTVVHLLAQESNPGDVGNVTLLVLQYFRKIGTNAGGTWTGPVTIDSISSRSQTGGHIASSPVSPKVAISYVHVSDLGFQIGSHGSGGPSDVNGSCWVDSEIFYRLSDSLGEIWGVPINATNYGRTLTSNPAGTGNPRHETNTLFDSEDGLHIIFNARGIPENAYAEPNASSFFFCDFSNSIYHWSDRTNTVSRLSNADYGIAWNSQHCGFGGNGLGYGGMMSVGECDGNLYTVWSQIHDIFGIENNGVPQFDDCATSGGDRGRRDMANHEIWMSVSSTLDGLLWDLQRNITQTYTPGCDSASALGGAGTCMSETRASLSRYGMDDIAMSATFGALTWPGAALLDPSGNYAGSSYLQLFYLEDHWPGSASDPAATGAIPAEGSLKWARLACIDPITAPQINFEPQSTGFPDQVDHGMQHVITVTITNDGNTGLNISQIGTVETAGPTGWLGVSAATLTVPAGATNTATFDITINQGGLVNSPGTLVALSGEVFILSDATVPRDSVSFPISNFIVGPVAPLTWDSVSTGAIQLTVSNHGEMGNGGIGGANMDYTASSLDCDPAQNVYLFDGSPVIVQKIDSAAGIFKLSTNLFTGGFAPSYAFKPVTGGAVIGSFTGPGGSDAMNTGTFVNWDSSIAVEQTYYAPTGGAPNDDFIIVKTTFSSNDGLDHANLLIGDVMDWDTPSDDGAANVAGIMGKTVYLKGIDTAVTPGCQLFANRFAGSTFLGMYSADEFTADNCANDNALQGAYASVNGTDNLEAQGSPNNALDSALAWNSGSSLTGQWNLTADTLDQRINQTYVWDYTLGATNSLTVYTALTTVLNGTVTDLDDNVKAACDWYAANLRPGCSVCSCCKGVTGNVDNDPADISDITDLTVLIDHLFINFPVLDCPAEANVDGDSGGLVDITDLTFLIDHLFINFPENSPCQ